MPKIFISYKRVDKEKVFSLKKRIEESIDEECWIDLDGIESDAQFARVIISAIDNSEIVLFMYSKSHSEIEDYDNDWTIRELNYASGENKRVVFLNLDNTKLSGWFKFMYGQKQQVNVNDEDAFKKLLADLRNWLGKAPLVEDRKKAGFLIEEDAAGDSRRILPLFFLLDISGSMYGDKIDFLNSEMEGIIPKLQEMSDSDPDRRVVVNVITFGSEVNSFYENPVDINDFKWQQLEPDGLTSVGKALDYLNDCLQRGRIIKTVDDQSIICAPVIILITDGTATDNYQTALENISNNIWFAKANKLGIAIGDEADMDMLRTFTGSNFSTVELDPTNMASLGYMVVALCEPAFRIGSISVGSSSLERNLSINAIKTRCSTDF